MRSYADGIDTDAALKRALNVFVDGSPGTFDKALEDKFGTMRARAARCRQAGRTRPSLDALKAAAAAKPEKLHRAARARPGAGGGGRSVAAYAPLQRASALVPTAIGPESPHALMAALAEKLNDWPRAIKEYEALLASDHTNVEAARKMWALAEGGRRRARDAVARHARRRARSVRRPAHTGWGRLALKKRDSAVATREFRAALQTGAADKAAAHCDLGESYLLAGRKADAKKEALAALEIAPSFERAQELLLNAVGG